MKSIQTFLSYKWQRPGEDIHEVRQPVRVLHCIELTDVHHIVLILEDGRYRTSICITKNDT